MPFKHKDVAAAVVVGVLYLDTADFGQAPWLTAGEVDKQKHCLQELLYNVAVSLDLFKILQITNGRCFVLFGDDCV